MGLTKNRFQTYDPYRSYSEQGLATSQQQFTAEDGENLFDHYYGSSLKENAEPELWKLGHQAYRILTKKFGKEPRTEEIYDCVREFASAINEWMANFLDNLTKNGNIYIATEDDKAWEGFLKEEYDLEFLVNILYEIEKKQPGLKLTDFEAAFAICCLYRVDDALIARLLGFGGFGDRTLEAHELLKKAMGPSQEKAVRSELAGMAAKVRHEETHALREEVIQYWRSNIDSKISAEKAATELSRIFPLSHRKLSQYISAERKLHRASKT